MQDVEVMYLWTNQLGIQRASFSVKISEADISQQLHCMSPILNAEGLEVCYFIHCKALEILPVTVLVA